MVEQNREEAKGGSSAKSALLTFYEHPYVQECKLMGLAHKILTISCCIFYFSVLEKVPISEMLSQNSRALG